MTDRHDMPMGGGREGAPLPIAAGAGAPRGAAPVASARLRALLGTRTGPRFVVAFLATWAILRVAHLVTLGAIGRIDRLLAVTAGALLHAMDVACNVEGAAIRVPNFVLVIADPCNGVELLEILLAIVIAFPTRWSRRAIGLAWMVPALLTANLIRICSLVGVVSHRPEWFEVIHQFVWQIVMVMLVFALGLFWMIGDARGVVARSRH